MSDQDHAAIIKTAADDLARKMTAASEAGLMVKVTIDSYSSVGRGELVIKRSDWKPSISVSRTIYL